MVLRYKWPMRASLLEFMSQGLRLGIGSEALSQVLRPLLHQTARPRALVLEGVSGRWARALLLLGCEVRREAGPLPTALAPGPEATAPPAQADLLCAGPLPGDPIRGLRELAAAVRPGGMVLLMTGRRIARADRAALCAAFLHAGLAAPVQQAAGMSLLTAGRVPT